jgi:adenylate cyclase
VSGIVQRKRLAAILAADAAGYSRLMAADENATVAALDSARSVFRSHIESNQGRVIDMAGDSVLAVFDTASGAVSAALAVQETLSAFSNAIAEDRRMRFRIGVHLGDVIEKADGTVYGDGVNIAARLEGLAEPGGITVSESIRSAVKGKVAAEFADLGNQSVKNITDPVHAYMVKEAASAATQSVARIDLSLPEKPSIAVLPFANMSGDPEQEYFTDGVSEDIITELSRFKSLFVIARNSTFTYKGRAVDVRAVAKDLGVRYVLEGSIRKASNRVRVTAQLIDSLTGNHIWAERYDRVLEDVFAVQEEVTRAIVAAIAPQVDAAERERARRRRPESLGAYEIAVRAYAIAWDAWIKSNRQLRDAAIEEARKALTIDPRSSLALHTFAFSQFQNVASTATSDTTDAWREGMAAVTKWIDIDPSDSSAYALKAFLLVYAGGNVLWDETLANARRAAELNPNNMFALNVLGHIESFAGNPDRSIEVLRSAIRLSPRDPFLCFVYTGLARACCTAGDYANGVQYASDGITLAAEFAPLHVLFAVNAVGLKDIESAEAALNTARRLNPDFVESRLRGRFPVRKPADLRRLTTFLRVAARLDEPSAADAFR